MCILYKENNGHKFLFRVSGSSWLDQSLLLHYFFLTGRLRPPTVFVGGMQPNRGTYIGNFGYQQPVSYAYQQGLAYPPYGYVPEVPFSASKPAKHIQISLFCVT